jgi:predicted transcriptional regulator
MDIQTYMWKGLIGQMTFPKKLQKFLKPLDLHAKEFNRSMTFPKQKNSKLSKNLKQNVN